MTGNAIDKEESGSQMDRLLDKALVSALQNKGASALDSLTDVELARLVGCFACSEVAGR